MQEAEGMTNMQNIPTTDTDFDMDAARSDESKSPVPPDKQPYVAPVNEPPTNDKRPIKEDITEPPRVMAKAAMYERRIF